MKKSEIEQLERQGCRCSDWNLVEIAGGTDLGGIRNVWFRGPVSIGRGSTVVNVPGGISNVRIGRDVRIENVARIENSADATFGIGTDIAVLDETGSRPVRIYPGISAQIAALAARMPDYSGRHLMPLIDARIKELQYDFEIGDGAEILDCGPIRDVRIWPGVKVEGAAWLKNGSIVNNAEEKSGLTYVGSGVNAENFIIEDATVANGVLLRNTYVGQGCVIDKGFTSHDSLFFANCSMENGEACAVLAGPYTVSMHKSSLLIGVQTSFMNAGSGTNMSNHMYKHGPIHWGVLERGVKTSSNAYLMHGSRIGAFSLVMGVHKTHPDTSDFPFSYLFDDESGHTIVVPGAMLKSFGLKRDSEKWPVRDRRLGHGLKLNDRITFSILNPHSADLIMKAIATLKGLDSAPAGPDGYIIHKGIRIKRSSLEKGIRQYELAICKYLHTMPGKKASEPIMPTEESDERWIDLLGQVISESELKAVLNADSIAEMEAMLDSAAGRSDLIDNLPSALRIIPAQADIERGATEFDAMVERDRTADIDRIARENEALTL
ncbi:MAG: DUF4954 family protein [Muribaculaceae bacterium]|nr:DUF4954 family protein [Muribaculaceae bacterium]